MASEIHKRDIEYSSDSGNPWEKISEAELAINSVNKQLTQTSCGEFVYGQGLKWYFSVIGWPIFILLLLEIGFRVTQTKYFIDFPETFFSGGMNVLRIIIFVYLIILAHKQHHATNKQTIAASVMAGILSGLALALFQLFWYFKLWAVFNLVGQPLLFAAEGLIISWLITKAFYKYN